MTEPLYLDPEESLDFLQEYIKILQKTDFPNAGFNSELLYEYKKQLLVALKKYYLHKKSFYDMLSGGAYNPAYAINIRLLSDQTNKMGRFVIGEREYLETAYERYPSDKNLYKLLVDFMELRQKFAVFLETFTLYLEDRFT